MNERVFIETIQTKSMELGINPLLLLSGIEGLYTFREVPLNTLNYEFLDSLILTIFALRIGDGFHSLAEERLSSTDPAIQVAAINELAVLTPDTIAGSANPYLQSFARLLDGKATVRYYHIKALEVAAMEIHKAQHIYEEQSIGAIVLHICRHDLKDSLDLAAFFGS